MLWLNCLFDGFRTNFLDKPVSTMYNVVKEIVSMKNEFDMYQKLCLTNQYKILRDLAILRNDKHDEELYENNITILQNGFSYDYKKLFNEFSNDMTSEECELVWNILDLYCVMKHSYDKIKNPSIRRDEIYFRGFDGNNEIQLFDYCKFIIFNLSCFCELTEDGKADFNSHCEMYNKYKKMVDKWISIGQPYDLLETQIKGILDL